MIATRRLGALLACLLVLPILTACSNKARNVAYVAQPVVGRAAPADTLINPGWRFVRSDAPSAQSPDFDDSGWQKLDLPHTFNAYDGQDGGGNYYRGPSWYRKHVKLARTPGERYFLRFEAAATKADVYVNGKHVGTHNNSFAAFCFDITDAAKPGDNVVAVRVDNTRTDEVPPVSGDFNIDGGIYRDVHLLTLPGLCISPIDDASPGVYLKQQRVADDEADVEVTVKLLNRGADANMAVLNVTVRDAAGNRVTNTGGTEGLAAGEAKDAVLQLHIDRPHLWNGRLDPYLYTVDVELNGLVGNKVKLLDRVTQPLGLRYYHFDPKTGFTLNGKPYSLHGVNRHQDMLDKGRALSQEDHERDFALIMELGCTTVRLAHYQHADYFYGLCDRGGLAVWAEACLVNDVKSNPAFKASAEQQLRELIKQSYNHPSILMWSLFNELSTPAEQPDNTIVKSLNALAHQLDDTRPTVGATHVQQIDHPRNSIPDLIGYNKYWGWYTGQPTDWAKGLDEHRAKLPANKPLAISEYGAGASIYQHEDPPTKPRTAGPWHSEEWQCVVHEEAYRAMKARPWLWGTYLWCMFDFASDGRHEGDQDGINDKGLVTRDRKTKKDAFYFYQANWTQDPMVHVTARRFEHRPTGVTQIKVYSNCDTVELFLNGQSLGQHPGDTCVFTWNATLKPGRNRVKAVATRNGKAYTDELTWVASTGATTRYSTTQPRSATAPATTR